MDADRCTAITATDLIPLRGTISFAGFTDGWNMVPVAVDAYFRSAVRAAYLIPLVGAVGLARLADRRRIAPVCMDVHFITTVAAILSVPVAHTPTRTMDFGT